MPKMRLKSEFSIISNSPFFYAPILENYLIDRYFQLITNFRTSFSLGHLEQLLDCES